MLVVPAGTVHGVDPSVLNTTEAPQEDGTIKKVRVAKRSAILRGRRILVTCRLIRPLPIKPSKSINRTGPRPKVIP
jgi:hypothetical protein